MSAHPKRGLLERLGALLMREPGDREQLVALLHSAYERSLLDSDALTMIEGVLQVSEMQARDIMVPRAQMDVIDVNETPDKFIPLVIATAHSRFPVIDGNRDNVVGVLLAKDLLRYYAEGGAGEFDIRDVVRPAMFVPESKRLNVLLREFRKDRHHMAIVVDEYGGTAGIITMEDLVEELIGDIRDEYDVPEGDVRPSGADFVVDGLLNLEDFEQRVNSDLVGKIVNIASRCAGFITKRFDGVLGATLDEPALVAEIEALPGTVEKVAHAAAVVGERFTPELVAEVAVLSERTVLGGIDELSAQGVIPQAS